MNERNDTTDADRVPQTMGEISHTNPYTGETAGNAFRRGPVVVADGGRANAADDEPNAEEEPGTDRTMKHVSHTPPNASEDASRAFERGRKPAADGEDEE